MALAVGDLWTAAEANLANRVAITFKDGGTATSGAGSTVTTAVRTVTDPYGSGVAYRCKVTYQLGFMSAAAGITCRAWVNINGTGSTWGQLNTLSSAFATTEVDMPSGGTVAFQCAITNLTGTVATFVDPTSHFMLTEIYPL
jgi:hypothetical protein